MTRPMMRLKYIGRGAFLPGVPSRDLNADEIKRYGGIEFLIRSGLYTEPLTRHKRKQQLFSPVEAEEFPHVAPIESEVNNVS